MRTMGAGLILPLILLGQAKPAPLPVAARQIIDECVAAFRAKDKAWFERRLAADFGYRDLKGERFDRDQALTRIGRWFRPLGYRVEMNLAPVSAKISGAKLRMTGDLKVRSQLFGFRRMPLTETTLRLDSVWRKKDGVWRVASITERSSRKTVDGQPVDP